uniref:Uncharacterized protein n=1 Tax=Glossina brevipalpis TaxID=37001 RepID=A0A1A9WP31_9MUSC
MDKGIYNSHNNNSNNRNNHYNQNNNIYILNSDQTILSHGTDIFNTNSSSYADYHYGPIPQTSTNQSTKPLTCTSSLLSLSSNVMPSTTSAASIGNKSQLLAKKMKFWKLLENEEMKNNKRLKLNIF